MARVTVAKARRKPMGGKPFSTNDQAWLNLKGKHKAYSKSHALPCARCRAPIDYSLPAQHRWAYETGHKQSRKHRPDLALIWNNLQAEHCGCNRSAQEKDQVPQQDWVQPSW